MRKNNPGRTGLIVILLDRTAANADGANYLLIKNNWQAAAKIIIRCWLVSCRPYRDCLAGPLA